MACALATIDVDGLAGHEAGGLEIEYRTDDVGDLAHAAERVQLGKLRMGFYGMHRRLDNAGRDRIHSDAGFAYSIASDLVAALRPPFVSKASTDGT